MTIYSIYQLTNKYNNKKYIGYTSQTPEYRWKMHQSQVSSWDSKWHRALKKYGSDSFQLITLYQTKCKQDALEKEKYFISHYNTIKEGYNTHEGGLGGNTGAYHKVGRKGILNPMYKKTHSEDKRKIMSEASKRWHSSLTPKQKSEIAEHTRKLQKGRKFSDEHLANIRKSFETRVISPSYMIYLLISPCNEQYKIVGQDALQTKCKELKLSFYTAIRTLLKGNQPQSGSCVGWKLKAIGHQKSNSALHLGQ